MAASNDLIVSSGRSRRGRVGFDRSASTMRVSVTGILSGPSHTNYVSICITMFQFADRNPESCLGACDVRYSLSVSNSPKIGSFGPTRLIFIDCFGRIGFSFDLELVFFFRRFGGFNSRNRRTAASSKA